jgi:hypothetical protein
MTQQGNRVYTVTDFDDSTDTVTIDGVFVAADEESPYVLVPWGPSGGGGDVTLADGSITAAKFDGLTAFPLTAEDANSTYIARTGADSDTLETLSDQLDGVSSQISAIGSGTGAALNYEVTEDNASSPIKTVTAVGSQTGTYANTLANDGTTHQVASVTNQIDWVYGFDVGAARAASKVVLRANMSQTGDTVTVSAYNFSSPGWDVRTTISGTPETLYDIPLFAGHTGTGADEGKVYVRFQYSEGDAGTLVIDEAYVQAQQSGSLVGYADGAIWVGGLNANTTPYVDGTGDNPVTWAAAQTLSASTGLTRFRIRNGTTVTLDAATENKSLIGRNWNLALGSQSISGSYIEGATVTGIGTAASAPKFLDCQIGAATLPPAVFLRCGIGNASGTFTGGAAGSYEFIDCYSLVGSGGTPTLTFTGLGASSYIQMRRWTAGSTLTLDADCSAKIDSLGGGVHTVVTGGGNLSIRGTSKGAALTISGSGTIDLNGVFGTVTIAGTAAGGTVASNGVIGTYANTSTGATVTNNAVSLATINTEVDTALNTAIPGSPTADSINQRIAAIDDLTQASGAGDLAAVHTKLGSPVDLGGGATIAFNLSDIEAQTDDIPSAATIADAVWDETSTGHVSAGKAGTQLWTNVDAILEDTGTTLDDLVDGVESELAKVPKSDSNVTWNATALASVNAEVVDALNTDTYAEPGQGAPGATISLAAKIGYLYKSWRNKKTQTATTRSIYDDAGTTVDQKATDSDDGTTFTKGELGTGP